MVDEIWINRAISKTGALSFGTTFLLKDVFDGIEWNRFSSGDKRDFGRQFKFNVKRGFVPNVIYVGKAQNNSAVYRKV